MAKRVVVVGSANMDLVFRTERFPEPGETVHGLSFETFPGGKGANQAVAIGKLGGDCLFVGKVGNDAFGDELARSLSASGVDVSRILRTSECKTGVASIDVDATGQNRIIVISGANSQLTAKEAIEAAEGFDGSEVTLLQHETPAETVAACIEEASKKCTVILNPAPAGPIDESLFPHIAFITPNESEAKALTGIDIVDESSCEKATDWFHDRGLQGVVITLGAKGCFVSSGRVRQHVESLPVYAVDTTAAGDAFNGALALFLSEGRDLLNSVQLANCVGALSVTKHGAQASMPTLSELRQFAGPLY